MGRQWWWRWWRRWRRRRLSMLVAWIIESKPQSPTQSHCHHHLNLNHRYYFILNFLPTGRWTDNNNNSTTTSTIAAATTSTASTIATSTTTSTIAAATTTSTIAATTTTTPSKSNWEWNNKIMTSYIPELWSNSSQVMQRTLINWNKNWSKRSSYWFTTFYLE